MGTETISTLIQVLVFSFLPFLVFVLKYKKASGFLAYIGLLKSNKKANLLGVLGCLLITGPILILVLTNPDFKEIMTDPNSITGKIRHIGFGTSAIVSVLLIALFKTALAEEILFRGFIAKRLIGLTNFQLGNILQAILFGIIHTLAFMSISSNVLFLILIFLFPTIGAYYMTFINEKLANGSIIPGWITHALANILSYSIIGFLF